MIFSVSVAGSCFFLKGSIVFFSLVICFLSFWRACIGMCFNVYSPSMIKIRFMFQLALELGFGSGLEF